MPTDEQIDTMVACDHELTKEQIHNHLSGGSITEKCTKCGGGIYISVIDHTFLLSRPFKKAERDEMEKYRQFL